MEERTCFNCAHYSICYRRLQMQSITASGINIDGDDAPGTMNSLFAALANACLDYNSHYQYKEIKDLLKDLSDFTEGHFGDAPDGKLVRLRALNALKETGE